jgi:hypothetical protein
MHFVGTTLSVRQTLIIYWCLQVVMAVTGFCVFLCVKLGLDLSDT